MTAANTSLLRCLPIVAVVFAGAHLTGLATAQSASSKWDQLREQMVFQEVQSAGITNERVLEAMRATPRHEFVPLSQRRLAYQDMALPIGEQQTISPPFVVAYMTEQIDPQPTDRVLEIGTGSGYQAAVLAPLVKDVYSIEIVPELGKRAARTLERLDYKNVHCRIGDGYAGWAEAAPFDKIIVTCSPEEPPKPLVEQLVEGGQMIVPVGERYQQNLVRLTKRNNTLERQTLRATLFVPMTGTAEDRRERQPDPAKPQIVNGDFTQAAADATENRPAAWHYVRQAGLVTEGGRGGPGNRCLRFANEEPGLGSQALQGFAVDGREVARLAVRFDARGEGIRRGRSNAEWPYLVITFYDHRRATLASEVIGPLRGTFEWETFERALPVPIKAREAIVRLGLLGATGRMWIDNVGVAAAKD
ncbi:protein-L-isoaspartate(D-aspartate) O-methyltransferase [Botrimarina hoheduenensis]|nr:protein-L-isoaspartate(D-aspartate) O-methyltransferase [Botrimarina hoheduenensis]